ncbi:MAG: hypothetical protein ACHQFX_19940 [Chitinophagales bacterium]
MDINLNARDYFFETGKVHKIYIYDKDGYIEAAEEYKENEERDSIAYEGHQSINRRKNAKS